MSTETDERFRQALVDLALWVHSPPAHAANDLEQFRRGCAIGVQRLIRVLEDAADEHYGRPAARH
jgi:hypothetical protein